MVWGAQACLALASLLCRGKAAEASLSPSGCAVGRKPTCPQAINIRSRGIRRERAALLGVQGGH